MLFKDIKSGYPVYFLNRESITAYQGKVVSVSVPRYDMQVVNKANAPLVVDITIEASGQTKTTLSAKTPQRLTPAILSFPLNAMELYVKLKQ